MSEFATFLFVRIFFTHLYCWQVWLKEEENTRKASLEVYHFFCKYMIRRDYREVVKVMGLFCHRTARQEAYGALVLSFLGRIGGLKNKET